MLPVLVVHGGAGNVPRQRAELSCAGVREAARAGYALLQSGRSAMDAVVEAVTLLENNPTFNAGCGSVLNEHGGVEMDALVMDGRTLASGAVSAVRRIANPVQLARLVMEKTPHLCLTAEGASKFARAMGVPEVPEETLITDYARKRWQRNRQPGANPVECQMGKMGTVGAVAVDSEGNVACATSTGGMLNKMEGRVGDTPCVGCGGYADNQLGAVSPTGHGEAIMKVTLSRLILFYMEQGKTAADASDQALAYMWERVQGLAGVVVVDPRGGWAARFNSLQMAWAAAQNEQLHYGLGKGEDFTLPLQDEPAASTQNLEQQHAASTQNLEQQHAASTQNLEQQHAASTQNLEQQHAASTQNLEQQHAASTHNLEQQHAASTHNLEQQHAASTHNLEQQ